MNSEWFTRAGISSMRHRLLVHRIWTLLLSFIKKISQSSILCSLTSHRPVSIDVPTCYIDTHNVTMLGDAEAFEYFYASRAYRREPA